MSYNRRNVYKKLKVFDKDLNMRRRLNEYLDYNSPGRSRKHSSQTPEIPKKRENKSDVNSDDSTDNSISDECSSDRLRSENLANTSMRNLYLKADGSQRTPMNSDISSHVEPTTENQKMSSRSFKTKRKRVDDSIESAISKTLFVSVQQSKTTFTDVGGFRKTLLDIVFLASRFKQQALYQSLGSKNPPHGFLLYGPSGCGKSLISHAIAGEMKWPLMEIAATKLVSGVSGESESKIREIFDEAIRCAPCILVIDKIDIISPKRDAAHKEMEKRMVTQLLNSMDELSKNTVQVMVIGITDRILSLDPALRSAGCFNKEICIGIPGESDRYEVLKIICKERKLSPEFDLHWLAKNTPGYVGADLVAVIEEATSIAIRRSTIPNFLDQVNSSSAETTESLFQLSLPLLADTSPISEDKSKDVFVEIIDFETAIRSYTPASKIEGFAMVPNVTWNDIGALVHIRKELQKEILWPIRYCDEYKEFHIPSPTGVLLYGPKGCGKTLLAKAIANESSINFLSVKGPELLNMYVGESERAVRECFQRAKTSAPCIIFFDEIDALCPSRSDSRENAVTDRVVNQLLTEIDGIEDRKQVFVMGATNRPDCIDSAMLRPGRLQMQIYVGVPNEEDRWDILKTITKDGTKPKLATDVCLEKISHDLRCHGFSGADLTHLVYKATVKAFEEYKTVNQDPETSFEVKLSHFDYAFSVVEPSITEEDEQHFKQMQNFPLKKNGV